MQKKLTAVVLTKNEAKQIENCLKSIKFADEIIIIDTGSVDKTIDLAKRYTKNIYKKKFTNFSDLRNFGLSVAKSEWILYVDADEEIPKELKDEIQNTIKSSDNLSTYYIVRRNYYFNKLWPVKDKIERLFKKEDLIYWYGEVHESPKIKGDKGEFKNELIHRSHNNLEEMLVNTNIWSDFEAQARFNTNHPPITWWRIFRMMTTSFWEYYIRQKGWSVGTVGLIESIYQSYSTFITYAKLWELQNNISMSSP